MAGNFLGVNLLFIGMVLIVNALWLQGKVETKDAGVFNLIVGLLTTLTALYFGLVEKAIPLAAGGMLFAITYLWVGINAIRGATDQRALGYYCLLVAITTVPYAVKAFQGGDLGWAFEWATYGVLWFLFYLLFAKGRSEFSGVTVSLTFLIGAMVAVTGWAYLYGYWPFGNWWPLVSAATAAG